MTNSRTHSRKAENVLNPCITAQRTIAFDVPAHIVTGTAPIHSAWKYLAFTVAILASRRNTRGNPCSRVQRRVDAAELLPGPDGNWNG